MQQARGGVAREFAFWAFSAAGEGAGFVLVFLFVTIACGLLRGC